MIVETLERVTDPAETAVTVKTRLGDVIDRGISCLLYTSDAADERSSVDLGGRRIIKKKRLMNTQVTRQQKTTKDKMNRIITTRRKNNRETQRQ